MGGLRQPRSSQLIYQRALLDSELKAIFADRSAAAASASSDAVASSSVRQAYAAVTGKAPAAAPPQQRDDSADCPICFEPLGTEKLSVCSTCRNGIHAECFQHWSKCKGGHGVPCPVCRAPWPSSDAGGQGRLGAEGFLNLASEAGVSSYRPDFYGYGGGWRGRHW